MVLPPPEATGEAAGEDAVGLLAVGGAPEQDLSRMLPAAVEPRIKNSRRLNCLVIEINRFPLNYTERFCGFTKTHRARIATAPEDDG